MYSRMSFSFASLIRLRLVHCRARREGRLGDFGEGWMENEGAVASRRDDAKLSEEDLVFGAGRISCKSGIEGREIEGGWEREADRGGQCY